MGGITGKRGCCQKGMVIPMKYSIKKQFAGIFVGLMAGTILLCWFINRTFLEKYYIQNRQRVLTEAYERVNAAATSGNMDSDAFDIELQKICSKYNITYVVIDADAVIIKSSSSEYQMLANQLLDNFFRQQNGERNKGILKEEEDYVIQNTTDYRTKTDYFEMWGILDNGNLFLFRTALEGIRDSVSIASRFLAYVGAASIFVGAIVITYVSKKVTEPILDLTELSKRMSTLDFEAKYKGSSKNEIAVLGVHMNQLSATLEKNISSLKTANNELEKDIEKKNRIDEMRKDFISNVSHELKTPIALIQGYAEGLKEAVNDDEESRDFYCDVIMDEAAKMNYMVKKLMTLSQLESGGDTITMERFCINDLIGNTVSASSIITNQSGIKVELLGFEERASVWADEFKIEEVFRNYFSNAIHHIAGEKLIQIKLIQMEERARICVFNTGEPIPVESLPFLWDKFYKVDKARTREYGGSGVGLSIVKAIMESLNQGYGVINYNNGVEFWFELDTK